jgi:hypothetical protein
MTSEQAERIIRYLSSIDKSLFLLAWSVLILAAVLVFFGCTSRNAK